MKPRGARADSVIPVNSPLSMKTVIVIDNHGQQIEKGNLYISILASSSKGNAILVSDGATSILVDAGLSGKQVEQKLKLIGFFPRILMQSLSPMNTQITYRVLEYYQGGINCRYISVPKP